MQETDFIKPNSSPLIIGVAGGSGSGKTFFSEALMQELTQITGENICEVVYQDNFYIDNSHRFDRDGGAVNFDHPDSIDFNLLASCLKKLRSGETTQIPVYDFATHKRKSETISVTPKKIIIVDGILIFHALEVRELLDEKLFFQTDEDLRFTRRLARDVKERGRTPEGVREQFYAQVKPMHDQFVEPSKAFANLIVDDVKDFDTVLKSFCKKLTLKDTL
jgi:uridine kinase